MMIYRLIPLLLYFLRDSHLKYNLGNKCELFCAYTGSLVCGLQGVATTGTGTTPTALLQWFATIFLHLEQEGNFFVKSSHYGVTVTIY
jgi:hypothetical protein